MKETLKAGCFLVKKDSREVALIYREKQKDYSFPKGHLEEGESLRECAMRETEEETKRTPILADVEPYIQRYVTPGGEACVCYMFIALDGGVSDNDSTDTHRVVWTAFDEVEDRLSYDSLKATWRGVKDSIGEILG